MKNRTRGTIFLLALTATIALLQACSEARNKFEVLSFNVKPKEVIVGETATITATVTSTGEKEDTYNVALMVNGIAEKREIVAIPAGGTKEVTFSLVERKTGHYKVAIGNQSTTLVVRDVPPPDFHIFEFSIDPKQVDVGEKVAITAKVKNTGGSKGSYVVQLRINDIQKEAQTVNLEPGKDILVVFVRTEDTPGIYAVTLGDAAGTYAVTEPVVPTWITSPQAPAPAANKSGCCPGGG